MVELRRRVPLTLRLMGDKAELFRACALAGLTEKRLRGDLEKFDLDLSELQWHATPDGGIYATMQHYPKVP